MRRTKTNLPFLIALIISFLNSCKKVESDIKVRQGSFKFKETMIDNVSDGIGEFPVKTYNIMQQASHAAYLELKSIYIDSARVQNLKLKYVYLKEITISCSTSESYCPHVIEGRVYLRNISGEELDISKYTVSQFQSDYNLAMSDPSINIIPFTLSNQNELAVYMKYDQTFEPDATETLTVNITFNITFEYEV
jgi:hypothetical protein